MGPRRFVIVLAGLLSACGLVVGPASGSCAFLIEWNGVPYSEPNIEQTPAFGQPLGEGTVPACDDTGSSGCSRLDDADDESIAIYRLRGIDPHVAFGAVTPSGDRQPFLASGFLTALPSHPLHRAIYGSPNRPSERSAPWSCGDPIPDLPGTVVHEPGSGVFAVRFQGDRVRRQYGYTAVAIDAKTTVTGFDEYGLPHIRKGDTLRATVRECTASGERYQVVADSIER
jgi:hypothetical protein